MSSEKRLSIPAEHIQFALRQGTEAKKDAPRIKDNAHILSIDSVTLASTILAIASKLPEDTRVEARASLMNWRVTYRAHFPEIHPWDKRLPFSRS